MMKKITLLIILFILILIVPQGTQAARVNYEKTDDGSWAILWYRNVDLPGAPIPGSNEPVSDYQDLPVFDGMLVEYQTMILDMLSPSEVIGNNYTIHIEWWKTKTVVLDNDSEKIQKTEYDSKNISIVVNSEAQYKEFELPIHSEAYKMTISIDGLSWDFEHKTKPHLIPVDEGTLGARQLQRTIFWVALLIISIFSLWFANFLISRAGYFEIPLDNVLLIVLGALDVVLIIDQTIFYRLEEFNSLIPDWPFYVVHLFTVLVIALYYMNNEPDWEEYRTPDWSRDLVDKNEYPFIKSVYTPLDVKSAIVRVRNPDIFSGQVKYGYWKPGEEKRIRLETEKALDPDVIDRYERIETQDLADGTIQYYGVLKMQDKFVEDPTLRKRSKLRVSEGSKTRVTNEHHVVKTRVIETQFKSTLHKLPLLVLTLIYIALNIWVFNTIVAYFLSALCYVALFVTYMSYSLVPGFLQVEYEESIIAVARDEVITNVETVETSMNEASKWRKDYKKLKAGVRAAAVEEGVEHAEFVIKKLIATEEKTAKLVSIKKEEPTNGKQ